MTGPKISQLTNKTQAPRCAGQGGGPLSPDRKTICPVPQTKLEAGGEIRTRLTVKLLLGGQGSTGDQAFSHSLSHRIFPRELLDLANNVTGHSVKFECNIWNGLILKKIKLFFFLKFKFNWAS